MCGINLNPLADNENDDFCAEALLSLQSAQEQELDRFYCPFPGCKRSFAELWRLKVHFRAPPNVRGSGKERGHGMRLTHCPKCGTALKIGGHHVRCSAREAARQHLQLSKKPNKRNATSAPKSEQQQQQRAQRQTATAAAKAAAEQQEVLAAQNLLQQRTGQQLSATADGNSAEHDDDTYAYGYQQYQQQWVEQPAWCDQQQFAQGCEEDGYNQQQQQVGYEHPTGTFTDQTQLQRLQELLRRVDQHLGYEQEPAQPAQMQQYCSTSSFGYNSFDQHQQQEALAGSVDGSTNSSSMNAGQPESVLPKPQSCNSSDSSTSSSAEGSSGDGSSAGGASRMSNATTLTAATATAGETEGDDSSYLAILSQQLQQVPQTGHCSLPPQTVMELLQQLLQHQHTYEQQRDESPLSIQLPPPQPLDCGLAKTVGSNLPHAAVADAVALNAAAPSAVKAEGPASAAAMGDGVEQSDVFYALLKKTLTAFTPDETQVTAAAPAADSSLLQEAELLRLLRHRCIN